MQHNERELYIKQMSSFLLFLKSEIQITPLKCTWGPGVVAHPCNPSTLGGEDRRIQVRSQPQLSPCLPVCLSVCLSLSLSLSLLSEALRNFVRPGFKIKYKK